MTVEPPRGERANSGGNSGGKKSPAGNWVSLGQMASTGIELALTLTVLALLGWWLDKQWNSTPWLLFTGVFIGASGSMYKLWRINKRAFTEEESKNGEAKK